VSLANIVYQGAVGPEAFRMKVLRGSSDVDLTTVTAVDFLIRNPDGTQQTWAAAISGATASQLTATHTFGPGDADQLGRHVVVARLTVPAGSIRTVPAAFQVVDPFAAGM
jgi:hypothetical protein